MGFFGLGKNVFKNGTEAERLQAVRELPATDQGQLASVALRDDSREVRLAAVGRLTDATHLQTLSRHKDAAVAKVAADRLGAGRLDRLKAQPLAAVQSDLQNIQEPAVLVTLALQAQDSGVRTAAGQRALQTGELTSGNLVKLAVQCAEASLALAAVEQLEDRPQLKEIAKKSKHPAVQTAAQEKIAAIDAEKAAPSRQVRQDTRDKVLHSIEQAAKGLAVRQDWQEARKELQQLRADLEEAVTAAGDDCDHDPVAACQQALQRVDEKLSADETAAKQFQTDRDEGRKLLNELQLARQAGMLNDPEQEESWQVRWAQLPTAAQTDRELKEAWEAVWNPTTESQSEIPAGDAAADKQASLTAEPSPEMLAAAEALIEQAETLSQSNQWRDADQRFMELDKHWRQQCVDIGQQHPLRERFLAAFTAFKDRRRQSREQQKEQVGKKVAALAEVVDVGAAELAVFKQADQKQASVIQQTLNELQDRWRVVGAVPARELGDLRQRHQENLTGLRALLQEAYQAADWERFAKVPQAEALIAQVQALVEAMPAAVEQAQASEQTAQSDDASEAAATDAPAEEEASQESAKAAPDAVQELLNQHRVASDAWKKMGALPRDANNRLWDAFKTAGDALYAAAEPYFAAENETRQANLAAKQQLVSRLQAIIDDLSLEMTGAAGAGVGVVASGGDGRQRHQDVQGLMKEWQAAGPLPREYAKELNGTWKALLDKHFSRRRQEMAALTAAQQENLPAKTAAVEGLQGLVARLGTPNSRTTEVYDEWQRLRRDYFSAGQVPRDDYQRLRADFEAAEEALNDGLADHLATLAEANEASVAERRVIVAELAEIASEEHPRWFADQVQALRQRWRDCGRLDRSQKGVEREYFDLLQAIDEDRTVPLAPATAESSSEEDSPAIDTESPQQGAPA